jgi:hypothetical protein
MGSMELIELVCAKKHRYSQSRRCEYRICVNIAACVIVLSAAKTHAGISIGSIVLSLALPGCSKKDDASKTSKAEVAESNNCAPSCREAYVFGKG